MFSSLTLNSWDFLILSVLAIIFFRLARVRLEREAVLVLFNIFFLYHFIQDLVSIVTLAGILGVTYLFGARRQQVGVSRTSVIAAVVIVGLWGILFLVRDRDLLVPLNIFSYFDIRIIGISYIVFRCISFILEVRPSNRTNILGFISYITFFPTILAGPIERFSSFNDQLIKPDPDENVDVLACLHRISNGMIKKFVIADNLAIFGIHAMQQGPENYAVTLLWVGALSQLFLIYLDFSGYCDIVIGISRLMGIKIRENFDSPFIARNIQEFWERWHISLSSFVKDYIFNPLIKLIFSVPNVFQSTLIMATYFFTMVLIALWHETTLGFLIFGLTHGAALVFIQLKLKYLGKFRIFRNNKTVRLGIDVFSATCTYSFVSISLILWLASTEQWLTLFSQMFGR